MSHINQYNYLQNIDKNIKEKTLKVPNLNPNSAVVRINPANLNNYQQIIKNDQFNRKNTPDKEFSIRQNNHQIYNFQKNNYQANTNNHNIIYPNNNIPNSLGITKNQTTKMKNTILKIKSDDQKDNIFRVNLRQERSADRVIEPQRQLITADILAKRRNDLNRSVNVKSTRTPQLYSATNRNTLMLNNNFNENKEKEKNKFNNINIINNLNYATINHVNGNINQVNNITINKNIPPIFTPIHANINLNQNNNFNTINKAKNENYEKSNENNRLFSPLINKNISVVANQTQKKGNNALNGTFKINTNNNIYTPNNQNLANNSINANNQNINNFNLKNNFNIKQIIKSNYNSNNTGTPNQKEKLLSKDPSNFSAREIERKEKDANNLFLNNYSSNNSNNSYSQNDNITNLNFFSKDRKQLNLIENPSLQAPKTPSQSKNIYNPTAKSVKEYSYSEDRNSSFRNSMEDYSKIIDKYMNDSSKGLFCLYDGHGGSEPVKFVCERFPDIFSKCLNENKNNIEKSLIHAFQKVDDELKIHSDCENVGTTACIVYIYKDADIITGGRKTFYCANIGDTRCILVTSNGSKRLSYDHKCTDETEVARIRKIGGVVFNGRVFGQLALSRALGDHAMKKYGVICTPHINKHLVSEKDRWIVICSDGVWDVISDEEVFDLSLKIKNSNEFSNLIVSTAIERGSRDNISCIVIKIN